MRVHDYFAQITTELKGRSDRIRLGFSTHRPTAGENREGIVVDFLRDYLPRVFGVDSGLILSRSGEVSNQADIVVVDQSCNAPLYPFTTKRLWLVESVYALIEVKTTLSRDEITDAVKKCRRFKTLPRDFATVPALPKIPYSLFVLWAFESPSPKIAKENILSSLRDVPYSEQPDFIVVPDSILVTGGNYREVSKLGLPNSPHRMKVMAEFGGNLDLALGEPIEVLHLGENSLLAWLTWFVSWLNGAGRRSASLASYLPKDQVFGNRI
jgi:hypothetical protein